MNDLMTKWFGSSWRSSLMGYLSYIVAIPGVYSAIDAWAHHQSVDWRAIVLSIVAAIAGTGLVNAKDKQVHSTPEEVQAAAAKAAEAKP